MNRQQIRNVVIANTRRSDKVEDINTSIDLMLQEISQVHDFRGNRVTSYTAVLAEGGNNVDLPADLFQIYQPIRVLDSLVTEKSYVAELKEKEWILTRWPDGNDETTGIPTFCYVDGSKLYFIPPAQEEWTIAFDYHRLTPVLSGDDATVQSGIEAALIARVTADIFAMTQQWQDFNQWMVIANRRLQIAITADTNRRETRRREPFTPCPVQVAGPPDYLDPFNMGKEH